MAPDGTNLGTGFQNPSTSGTAPSAAASPTHSNLGLIKAGTTTDTSGANTSAPATTPTPVSSPGAAPLIARLDKFEGVERAVDGYFDKDVKKLGEVEKGNWYYNLTQRLWHKNSQVAVDDEQRPQNGGKTVPLMPPVVAAGMISGFGLPALLLGRHLLRKLFRALRKLRKRIEEGGDRKAREKKEAKETERKAKKKAEEAKKKAEEAKKKSERAKKEAEEARARREAAEKKAREAREEARKAREKADQHKQHDDGSAPETERAAREAEQAAARAEKELKEARAAEALKAAREAEAARTAEALRVSHLAEAAKAVKAEKAALAVGRMRGFRPVGTLKGFGGVISVFLIGPALKAAFVWYTAPKGQSTAKTMHETAEAFGNSILPPDAREVYRKTQGNWLTKSLTALSKAIGMDQIAASIDRINADPKGKWNGFVTEFFNAAGSMMRSAFKVDHALENLENNPQESRAIRDTAIKMGTFEAEDPKVAGSTLEAGRDFLTGNTQDAKTNALGAVQTALQKHPGFGDDLANALPAAAHFYGTMRGNEPLQPEPADPAKSKPQRGTVLTLPSAPEERPRS